jgi:hypothetical protein
VVTFDAAFPALLIFTHALCCHRHPRAAIISQVCGIVSPGQVSMEFTSTEVSPYPYPLPYVVAVASGVEGGHSLPKVPIVELLLAG